MTRGAYFQTQEYVNSLYEQQLSCFKPRFESINKVTISRGILVMFFENTLFFLLEQFYKNNEAQKCQKNKNNLRTTLSLEWLNFRQIKGLKR